MVPQGFLDIGVERNPAPEDDMGLSLKGLFCALFRKEKAKSEVHFVFLLDKVDLIYWTEFAKVVGQLANTNADPDVLEVDPLLTLQVDVGFETLPALEVSYRDKSVVKLKDVKFSEVLKG